MYLCWTRISKNYDAVIMLDCDFQHPIELIDEMIKKYSLGYEIVAKTLGK